MKGRSSRRDLINVAFNGLVSTGVIAGFRTNYEPDEVQITVTSLSGARQESIRAKVRQALGKGAKIVIEPSGRPPARRGSRRGQLLPARALGLGDADVGELDRPAYDLG